MTILKSRFALRIAFPAVLIGALMSVLATTAFAQTTPTPPAYLVVEFEVVDQEAWKQYGDAARKVPGIGKFVVRGTKGQALAGTPPQSITILCFDSLAEAVAFDSSPEYVALKPLRDRASKWRSYVVTGVSQ